MKSMTRFKQAQQQDDGYFLPDFCNIRITLAVVIAAELLAVVLSVAGFSSLPSFWSSLSMLSLYIQWIALGSTASLCLFKPVLKKFTAGMSGLAALLLALSGYFTARHAGIESLQLFLPLFAAAALLLLDGLPGRIKSVLMIITVAAGGVWVAEELQGLNRIFGMILVAGGLLIAAATAYRSDARRGFFPLLAALLLSLATLLTAHTTLEFFFSWEVMTLSSYLLITLGRDAVKPALLYLLFSLGSAFLLLAGFAVAFAATGSIELAALGDVGEAVPLVFSLLALGFVIKAGAFGFHIWLPGSYAEADDDTTAILSAVWVVGVLWISTLDDAAQAVFTEAALFSTMTQLKGAFSIIMLTNQGEVIGLKDPHGFRPLCLGKLNGNYVLASETCALDLVEAEFVRELDPGEKLLGGHSLGVVEIDLPGWSGDFVAVLSGLQPDDRVVSTGVFKFRNGQPVVVDNSLAPEFKLAPRPEDS